MNIAHGHENYCEVNIAYKQEKYYHVWIFPTGKRNIIIVWMLTTGINIYELWSTAMMDI